MLVTINLLPIKPSRFFKLLGVVFASSDQCGRRPEYKRAQRGIAGRGGAGRSRGRGRGRGWGLGRGLEAVAAAAAAAWASGAGIGCS